MELKKRATSLLDGEVLNRDSEKEAFTVRSPFFIKYELGSRRQKLKLLHQCKNLATLWSRLEVLTTRKTCPQAAAAIKKKNCPGIVPSGVRCSATRAGFNPSISRTKKCLGVTGTHSTRNMQAGATNQYD